MRHRTNARAGTEVRYHRVPTPHLCPRITDKTLPADDDMMIPKNDDSTIQETGPLAVCEGSARLKMMPSFSFDLKIVGTTIWKKGE